MSTTISLGVQGKESSDLKQLQKTLVLVLVLHSPNQRKRDCSSSWFGGGLVRPSICVPGRSGARNASCLRGVAGMRGRPFMVSSSKRMTILQLGDNERQGIAKKEGQIRPVQGPAKEQSPKERQSQSQHARQRHHC